MDYHSIIFFVKLFAIFVAFIAVLYFVIKTFIVKPANILSDHINEGVQNRTTKKFGNVPCGRYHGFALLITTPLMVLVYYLSIIGNLKEAYSIAFLALACVALVAGIFFIIFPGDKKITYEYCANMAGKNWGLYFVKISDTKHKIIWATGVILGIYLYLNIQVLIDTSILPYPVTDFILKHNPLLPIYVKINYWLLTN